MIKYPYSSTMRYNGTNTFDVNWMIANDDAATLPYVTAFGSSRFDVPDQLDIDRLGEIYVRHPPFFSGKVPAWMVGGHICGSAAFWQNGWPVGTPGLPLGPDGVPACCGQAPAAFDFGYDLGFDS